MGYITNIVQNADGTYTITDVQNHQHTLKVLPDNPEQFIMLIDHIAEMLQNAKITFNTSNNTITIQINW